jgi:hypothetical protein
MPYKPSLKVIHAFLDPGTPKALSLSLAALITGALSQAEAAIELTNRVYDSVFHENSQRGTSNTSLTSPS